VSGKHGDPVGSDAPGRTIAGTPSIAARDNSHACLDFIVILASRSTRCDGEIASARYGGGGRASNVDGAAYRLPIPRASGLDTRREPVSPQAPLRDAARLRH
jgi:hypothetical protein